MTPERQTTQAFHRVTPERTNHSGVSPSDARTNLVILIRGYSTPYIGIGLLVISVPLVFPGETPPLLRFVPPHLWSRPFLSGKNTTLAFLRARGTDWSWPYLYVAFQPNSLPLLVISFYLSFRATPPPRFVPEDNRRQLVVCVLVLYVVMGAWLDQIKPFRICCHSMMWEERYLF